MGLSTTMVRGSLWRRPARTLASVLGVALGIAIVVAIFTVDYNTILHSQPDRGEGFVPDLEVRAPGTLGDPGGTLSQVEGVGISAAVYKASLQAFRDADPRSPALGVSLMAMESAKVAEMGVLVVESGEFIGNEPNRVMIGRALSEQLRLSPGDAVWLAPPARAPLKDCVEGQVVSQEPPPPPPRMEFQVDGVLAYENVGQYGGGAVVVMNVGAALELFGDRFLEPSYWVARDPNVDVERLEEGLAQNFAYDLRQGAVVGQKADERAFRNGVRLAGMLALGLGLFVIFHTLSMSLVERMREVAVLGALGASRAQIAWQFLVEAVLISGLAGLVGLFGGLGLAKLMLSAGITSLGVTSTVQGVFDVPWREALGLTGLGVAIALIGSVFPLLKAKGSDLTQGLRGEDLEIEAGGNRGFHVLAALLIMGVMPVVFLTLVPLVGEAGRELLTIVFMGVAVLLLLVGTPLLVPGIMSVVARKLSAALARLSPFAGLLAARSIARNPSRIAASVAAIALVTAAFVGLRGLTGSLHYETKLWAAEAIDHKVFFKQLQGVDWRALAEELRRDERVRDQLLGVEPGSFRVESPFRVVGVDLDEVGRFGPLAEDEVLREAFANTQGILISSRVAVQRGLAVNDSVALATPWAGVQQFRVLAVSDAYGYVDDAHERAYGVVRLDAFRNYFCMDVDHTDLLAVRLAGGDGFEEAREAIEPAMRDAIARLGGKPGDVVMKTGSELREYELFDILRDFLVFDVIILLTLLIAGVGVLNGQLLSAMERFKELGVLRALGASPRQIRNSVIFESCVIGAIGGLIGVGLGYGMVYLMIDALKLLSGLELPYVGFQWDYLLAVVGAFLVTVLAGFYPVWKMNRMDPVRAVRTG